MELTLEQRIDQQQQRQRRQQQRQQQQQRQLQQQEQQRREMKKHDQMMLFKISNGKDLKKKFCTILPILVIIDSMGKCVSQNYKRHLKDIEKIKGSYAATEKLLTLATASKLRTGWSGQLLQTIATLGMKDLEELISLKQADLEKFNERIGIPHNSLLDRLSKKQRDHCSILKCPMGKDDSIEESRATPVPVVHPQINVSVGHFRTNTAFPDGRYKSPQETQKAYEGAHRVSFEDVTESKVETPEFTNKDSEKLRAQHGLSLCIIGAAGAGKTTMTKRMVTTCMDGKKMPFLIPFAQIDKDDLWSVKTLLTKFLCRFHDLKPSEEEIDEAFHWILANQEKCFLIFDGLDQSSFVISNEPIVGDINDEFLPGDLMSLLLSRQFLPNTRIAVTSRPHSLVQFAPAIQPDIVLFLNDLVSDDVEKLMNHYLDKGTASEMLEKLRTKSPRIHQLTSNPLLLRLIALLSNEKGENVWTDVNTIAKLFFEIVDLLQLSAHHERGDIDVEVLNRKLAAMAFHKTIEGSVVFEQSDLERYGLSGENVQDFLFGALSSNHNNRTSNNALLVGLMNEMMKVYFFHHQSTQEFFSAIFSLEQLSVDKFEEFVGKLFPRLEKDAEGYLSAGEDSFANLRVFVIGMNEIKDRHHLDEQDILRKKKFFINFLCDHLRELFVEKARADHQRQMFVDMMDFRDEELNREIRQHLNDFNFWFKLGSLPVAAHREGFFHFMQHFVSNVRYFFLHIDQWSDDEIRRLFELIQSSTAKIEEMLIWMNPQQLEHASDHVVAILPHLTRKLRLRLYGGADELASRKLKEEIELQYINFDTSNLQTEELKVKVEEHMGDDNRTLLRVVLRRGQPPQFN